MKHDIEEQDRIIKKYPDLFVYCTHFDCGPGWYEIIDELCHHIQRIAKDIGIHPHFIQIKEKMGTLRFNLNQIWNELETYIDRSEYLSSVTCENCGRSGELFEKGWLKTRCKGCRDV